MDIILIFPIVQLIQKTNTLCLLFSLQTTLFILLFCFIHFIILFYSFIYICFISLFFLLE